MKPPRQAAQAAEKYFDASGGWQTDTNLCTFMVAE